MSKIFQIKTKSKTKIEPKSKLDWMIKGMGYVLLGIFVFVVLCLIHLAITDPCLFRNLFNRLPKNAYSAIYAVLVILSLHQIVANCLWRRVRKWKILVIYAILGLVVLLAGQIVDYVEFQAREADRRKWPIGQVYSDKPIIYLYPTEVMDVSVRVGKPENLAYTYPVYRDGWFVRAEPTGDLTDTQTDRHYYALYWEGVNKRKKQKLTEGFVVAKEDTIPFLEEKLELLGLTEREANEFIVYWLPRLGENRYNFIRFQTMSEQNESMPLMVEPRPDTVIRVMMEFRGLNKPIRVDEQRLEMPPERSGFTLVEWGGTEI